MSQEYSKNGTTFYAYLRFKNLTWVETKRWITIINIFFHIFYDDVQNIDINFIPPIFIPIYLIICSVVVIVNGFFHISSRGDVKRRKIYSSFKAGKLCECLLTIVSDTTSTRSLTFERWYSVSDWFFFGVFNSLKSFKCWILYSSRCAPRWNSITVDKIDCNRQERRHLHCFPAVWHIILQCYLTC